MEDTITVSHTVSVNFKWSYQNGWLNLNPTPLYGTLRLCLPHGFKDINWNSALFCWLLLRRLTLKSTLSVWKIKLISSIVGCRDFHLEQSIVCQRVCIITTFFVKFWRDYVALVYYLLHKTTKLHVGNFSFPTREIFMLDPEHCYDVFLHNDYV